MRVRGRSDDGQVVRWTSGERQVNFRWSLNSLNQGKVRVLWWSGEGQMLVRWISGECQVNLNLSLTLLDMKLVRFIVNFFIYKLCMVCVYFCKILMSSSIGKILYWKVKSRVQVVNNQELKLSCSDFDLCGETPVRLWPFFTDVWFKQISIC